MSLLGYFWFLNSLSFLDAFITVTGIKMNILYESNPIVNFFIESYGLNRGMFIVKMGFLVLLAVMFKLHVPGSNLVRNSYIALIALYFFALSQMTATIYLATNV